MFSYNLSRTMAGKVGYHRVYTEEDLPPLPGSFGSADFQVGADVRFVDLKEVYEKSQSRSGGVAKQRVDDGLVHMEAQSPVGQILGIKVWVLREPQAAELHRDRNGPVELPVNHGEHDIEKHCFSVNLDAIYDGPVAPVYELAKVEMNKRNLFQLLVELSFHNGLDIETQRFYSNVFRMKSKPRQPGSKRPRPGDDEDQQESDEVPAWSSSPDSTVSVGSADFQHLRVLDHLEAKRAHIEHLSFTTSFPKNTHADIGYHFKLKDPEVCNEYEEGDVVGFFKDDNGTTSIKLLDNKNGKEAFMAGVISRSTYLEAKPRAEDDDPTDVVCVIGVVSVKCLGSVRAGERVYASIDPDSPGTAIPESHLPPSVVLGKTSLLLGMSLEDRNASKLDDTHLVQCFVCIVLGVSDKQITMEIENLYQHFEMDLGVRLRKERKKFYKMLCRVIAALLVVLCLVGVLLYEVFFPGSAFRYWICARGSIESHTCTFKFIPYGDTTQRFWVHGVEFEWKKLARQLDDVPPMNSTIVPGTHHYFLNIDRCAYGGIKLSSTKDKQVGGALVFAVNHNCTAVYYYQNAPHPGWKMYQSVAKYFQHDLICKPKDAFQ